MQDTRTSAPVESARRTAVRRRAKRGLVAGYIHELSARHGASVRPETSAQPARATEPGTPLAGALLTESEAGARV